MLQSVIRKTLSAHALGPGSLFLQKPRRLHGVFYLQRQIRTVITQPAWHEPFKRGRRCLIPADGFYEWAVLGPKEKQPYAFTVGGESTFAFADLWDAWRDKSTDQWLQSFPILTTSPNELTQTVHTRMPVILHGRDYNEWLLRDDGAPPLHLLRPFLLPQCKLGQSPAM